MNIKSVISRYLMLLLVVISLAQPLLNCAIAAPVTGFTQFEYPVRTVGSTHASIAVKKKEPQPLAHPKKSPVKQSHRYSKLIQPTAFIPTQKTKWLHKLFDECFFHQSLATTALLSADQEIEAPPPKAIYVHIS